MVHYGLILQQVIVLCSCVVNVKSFAFGPLHHHHHHHLRVDSKHHTNNHHLRHSSLARPLAALIPPTADIPLLTAPPVLETQVIYDLLDFFNGINTILFDRYQTALTTVLGSVKTVSKQEVDFIKELWNLVVSTIPASDKWLTQQYPTIQPVYDQIKQLLLQGQQQALFLAEQQPLVAALAASLVAFGVVSSLIRIMANDNNAALFPPPTQPYPLLKYDPVAARQYFDRRWPMALARTAQITWTSLNFALSLWMDQITNKLDERADLRGLELAQLLTQLGPSFIKIGQSLSIRTDLLSPAYIRGLATLQDQVPPFDSKTAFSLLQDEWGVADIYQILKEISPEPVAAASLGQVYKATLRNNNNTVVAIKVQRPDILEQIALDMYLLREMAPIVKQLFQLNTDTVGTVDAWGKGFVDELDYIQEADNAKVFIKEIAKTPLKDVVLAPNVVDEYTTRQVLMTEWVDGERLDKSSAKDVTILCSIAMNTYLTMMLEIGLLHSDPHPGNLLRTPDGKLCVLDWGMVTRLDHKLQLTLIEHMAHLTSADYDEIPRDLVLLGFIPTAKAQTVVQDSDVVQVLAEIYSAWTRGGGAAAINVNRIIAQLQDLQATRGSLFQIPPYFAYIAKSFSVLEGIGLSNDPQYSIVNECLPYVSKRLLTDKDSMGPALSTFLFGPEKSNLETRIVDYKRVEQLVTGFSNYTSSALFSGAALATNTPTTVTATSTSPGSITTTTTTTTRGRGQTGRTAIQQQQFLETTADQVLDLVLTEEETPLQEILVEQLAKIISSTSRSVWTQLRERSGTLPSGRTVLGTLVDPFGFWRTSPLVRMNELDERTVETTRKLIVLLQNQLATSNQLDLSTLSRDDVVTLSSILVRKVWDRRLGLVKTGNRLAMKLLQLTADKLERGERDTRRLIEPRPQTATTTTSVTTVSPTIPESVVSPPLEQSRPVLSSSPASLPPSSSRLNSARQLLADLQVRRDLQDDDDDDFFPMIQPIKTKLL